MVQKSMVLSEPTRLVTEHGELIATLIPDDSHTVRVMMPDDPETHRGEERTVIENGKRVWEVTVMRLKTPPDSVEEAVKLLEALKASDSYAFCLSVVGMTDKQCETTLQELKKGLKPKP